MDGRMVHNDNGLWRDRLTQGIKTPYDHTGVERLFQPRGMQIIVTIPQSSHVDPSISHRRAFNDFTRFLPRIGDGRIQGQSRFINIVPLDLPVGFRWLQRFQGTLPAVKGCRVAQRF